MPEEETLAKEIARELTPQFLTLKRTLEHLVPEITVPPIRVPQPIVHVPPIKVPKAEVTVTLPKTPEPKVTVTVPEIVIPPFPTIPKPEVTVVVDKVRITNLGDIPTGTLDPKAITKPIVTALKRLEQRTGGGGGGGPTEYLSGQDYSATTGLFGSALLWEDASRIMRSVTATYPLPVTATVTGSPNVVVTGFPDNEPFNLAQYGGSAVGAGNAIHVQPGTAATFPVSGTFWQTTQPVSMATLPDTAAGDLAALRAGQLPDGHNVTVDNASIAVTGTFWQATQPISAASLPLPSGAATSAAQTDKSQFTKITDGTDTVLVTAAGELNVIATAQPGVDIGDVTINNASLAVTGTFWQATQPVSLASVPSHAVTNAGVFAVQVDGAALTALQTIDNFISGTRGLVTEDNSAAIKTAVEALDNSVDGNYLNVNLNMAGTDAAANAGAISAVTQRVVQAYNTDWITLRVNYTAAQTNISMITAAASEKIIVKSLDVMSDNACSVDVAVLIGFDDTTTPTGADCILSHPGIAPGSGISKYYGSDGVTGATAADDLKITSEVPTGGSISIVIIYKIISV